MLLEQLAKREGLDCRAQLQDIIFEMEPFGVREINIFRKNNFEIFVPGIKKILDGINKNYKSSPIRMQTLHGRHKYASVGKVVLRGNRAYGGFHW
jgi:hypothetical protein